MQITILNLKHQNSLTEQEVISYSLSKYKINKNNLKSGKLVKKSLDLRDKNNPIYVYQLVLELNNDEKKNKNLRNKNIEFNTKYTDKIEVSKVTS